MTTKRPASATLADVAAQAGVSKVAASVVLNGSRSHARVSATTRERIIEAASALQYKPNAVARSLRRQHTNIIGFYSAHGAHVDPRVPFFAQIWAGLREGCAEHQKDLLVRGAFRSRSDDEVFQELLNGQVDGLILFAGAQTPLVERLIESRLPVISVVHEVPGVPWLGIDDTSGGQSMARHLWERGHRRVLYRRLAGKIPSTLQRRLDSFCAEAGAMGMTVLQSHRDDHWPSDEEQALLLDKSPQRPTAVACWNDDSADALAEFCQQQGLRVPHDIAITGFDGVPPVRRPAWRITTIAAPWVQVARQAVTLLTALCQNEEVPPTTMLPVELVVGDTT